MLGHLERVLEQVAADADVRLSQLELLGEAERALVLEEWNRTEAEYPADRCIHELFEAQAARTPGAVAVRFEEESLTYRELNERANRLAHYLRRRGVGPEVRVGICLERSLEMVVGILAVLKAGGAYVPLDPAYPAERLAFILADSATPVLLTRETLRGALPAREGVEVVSLDGAAAEIAAESAENPESGAGPDSLAYVIYTSGSTGRPKGALIEHRNVARLFSATDAWFGFGAEDVWTLFHSYAFDFSVWELWGALLYGGRVVVVPCAVSRDPEAFHALVQREGVTVLNQTPSAFRQFMRVDAERGGELALRVVVFGGEALEPATLRDVGGAPRRRDAAAGEHVRDHRDHRARDLAAARPRGRLRRIGQPHRRAHPRPAAVRARPGAAAGAGRGARRAVRGRRGGGARLPEPPGADRGALRRGPVRRPAGCTAPATGCGGWRTGRWSTWAAWTSR